ncbi:hypothetical protein AC791_15430 [Klebsiella sp. RIT-PI-d]|uniref:DNA-packaging protein FI n=1 Tax=Klebsiella sp. RIT-PI-d TaxID=1681196 RepID=UPI0006760922|nr:DNA-packaging protein FI [Klebsiella sp. RIT-PI-d]KNC09999.1 hypothetical protein AC791_15430 [Klebsiella sp. RIT-PI-d]
MTKDELIARLKALGAQLGRDVSLAGSKEELAMRVAELEEELEDDGDGGSGDVTTATTDASVLPGPGTAATLATSERSPVALKKVVARATLHIDAIAEDDDIPVPIATLGTVIRISSQYVTGLVNAGLVEEA